jgi:N-acetylglucosaminyl-diphospho-decaprenol L-rhamnosyltransferase
MDISFIIVNYKSRQYLPACLRSLRRNVSNMTHEVIVVNNDKEPLDNTVSLEDVSVIEHGSNTGFGSACNIGSARAAASVLFFLNPDTEILSANFQDICRKLDHQSTGAIAPRLVGQDGKTQPWSVGYDVTPLEIIKNNLGIIRSKRLWEIKDEQKVDWVSGGAFAIKKDVFLSVGGFDEDFFMYFEDVDLCRRLREYGKEIIYVPAMEVLHLHGKSSPGSARQKEYYYRSQDYYFKKHFGKLHSIILRALRAIFGKI